MIDVKTDKYLNISIIYVQVFQDNELTRPIKNSSISASNLSFNSILQSCGKNMNQVIKL